MFSAAQAATSLRCRGMSDLSPAEMTKYQQATQAFREASAAYGYGEIRTPTIETLHLFTAAGTLSPQMLSRVYSFLDWDGWSGERVVLRPDATIPAVRFYTENFAPGQVAKLAYVENVFRFAEGDESREDWQCGLEVIGDTAPIGDIELIQVALTVLERIGVPDLEVRISNAALVRAILAKTELPVERQSELNDRILDGDPTVIQEVEEALPAHETPLHILLGMDANNSAFLSNVGELYARSLPELRKPLLELTPMVDTLQSLGYRLKISALLVRNFQYYTGPVFQIWSGSRLLGAGGRYDNLVGLASGHHVPASGIALHLDAVTAAMGRDREVAQPTVRIHPVSTNSVTLPAAFAAAAQVTSIGCRALIGPGGEDIDSGWELLVDDNEGAPAFRLHNTSDGSWKILTDTSAVVRVLHGAQS